MQREWMRRVQAEYRSAAITHQLTHWLIQIGAPPALIRDGLRIVADELTHAELSHRVFRAAGGTDLPAIARESLVLARTTPELEHDVARVTLDTFCLGETAAVRLFHRMRARAKVKVAHAALGRVLRDEVRHRDFGWRLLGWLLTLPGAPQLRAAASAALPQLLAKLRANYGGTGEAEPPAATGAAAATDAAAEVQHGPERPEALSALDLAWGLMPVRDYRAAIALCIERDLRPRFARLELAL